MNNIAVERNLTAGVYIRLSKEDRNKQNKDDDSESIVNQRRMLLDYCRQNGINVYDIYNDEDFSGSDRERPEFNRMIEDARTKKINLVVCKTQSRFARDMEIVEKYINVLFPEWGVRFIGVVDNTDNSNIRNLKQRQINSLVDEWYISDLSANIRATLSSKRKEGLWVGAFAPYGYIKDPNNKNRLVIDEEAAEIVRYVFSLYLSGMGITSITRRLNDEGIPNPASYKKAHGQPFQNAHRDCSDIWHTYTVGRMLSNEVYIGSVVQGMSENVSYKSTKKRKKAREEWNITENVHTPIIDRDIWDKVQRMRGEKPKSLTRYDFPNIFANKVRCADCGGSMRIYYTNRRRYYRCETRYIAPSRCGGKYISEAVLKHAVLDEIRCLYSLYVDEDNAAEMVAIPNGYEQREKRLAMLVRTAEDDAKRLDGRLEALYIDKLDGVIDQEEFAVLKTRFRDEKYRAEKKANALRCELDDVREQMEKKRSSIEIIRGFKDITELDFETVQVLIDHIEIGGTRSERVVNIHWNL